MAASTGLLTLAQSASSAGNPGVTEELYGAYNLEIEVDGEAFAATPDQGIDVRTTRATERTKPTLTTLAFESTFTLALDRRETSRLRVGDTVDAFELVLHGASATRHADRSCGIELLDPVVIDVTSSTVTIAHDGVFDDDCDPLRAL
ncbi:MAG: hypothetical protein AAF211_07445 [Myxococcota bacterium]